MSSLTAAQNETYMMTMTAREWADVPDNPRQRDTHARLSKARHLNVLEPSHTLVHMAEWSGGRCKLEGHTRALKWMQSPETAPDTVDVRVYVVDSVEDAKRLYGHFNSKEEAEKSNDRLFGALRELGITPTSEFIRKAKFTNAVSMAYSFYVDHSRNKSTSIYDKVMYFRDQIVQLDCIASSCKRMFGAPVCCFLLASAKRGPAVCDFFCKYIMDGGYKDGKQRDSVQLFSQAMEELRSGGLAGWAMQEKAVARGLWCIERWLVAPDALMTRMQQLDPWSYRDR